MLCDLTTAVGQYDRWKIMLYGKSFQSKRRYRFTQYIPNKPDKFRTTFWLVYEVNSKYIIVGFLYSGKDKMKDYSIPFGKFVVFKLMNSFTDFESNCIN